LLLFFMFFCVLAVNNLSEQLDTTNKILDSWSLSFNHLILKL
jgi:hypothetical protein